MNFQKLRLLRFWLLFLSFQNQRKQQFLRESKAIGKRSQKLAKTLVFPVRLKIIYSVLHWSLDKEIEEITSVLSGIIHLGHVKFCRSGGKTGVDYSDPLSEKGFDCASRFLGINDVSLNLHLANRVSSFRKQIY